MSDLTLRPFSKPADFDACVQLQREIWGPSYSEIVPASTLKIGLRLGGVASGAWDETGRMQGFVFGMTGPEGGRLVHWSDLLGVRAGARGSGLGRALKVHQRDLCLSHGIETVYWTFDPLEARNGWLNLNRLGAVAREYAPDLYGNNSPLNRDLATDRFIARWDIASERVRRRVEADEAERVAADAVEAIPWEEQGGLPVPLSYTVPDADRFLVPVPADINAVRAADDSVAGAWRWATRAVLHTALRNGWEARELIRGPVVSRYLLVHPSS